MKSKLTAFALLTLFASVACGDDDAPSTETTSSSGGHDAGSETPRDAGVDAEIPVNFSVRGGAVFQGVKLPVFGEGAKPGADLPIVIQRKGVFRTYLDLRNKAPTPVTVTLFYKDAAGQTQQIENSTQIKQTSDDSVLGSCVDLELPAEAFHEGLEIAVEVRKAPGAAVLFRSPETGMTPLHADPRTDPLEVVVVPVHVQGADEEQYEPDVSAPQLERMRDAMHALYPISSVQVRLRETPLIWSQPIRANGQGWDELLYAILQEREADAAPPNVYYYGLFAPARTLNAFCNSGSWGCVLGLSELSRNALDAGRRGSIGLGFSGFDAAETFVHEVGHAHGRYHAPCGGAGGPDRKYPYLEGDIGVAGWDIRTGNFLLSKGRNSAKDFMGYCAPIWVSDYTWSALFERITAIADVVDGSSLEVKPMREYRLLRVQDEAPPRWIGARRVRGAVSDDLVQVTIGGQPANVARTELDHLPGHVLYVPTSWSGRSLAVPGVGALEVP